VIIGLQTVSLTRYPIGTRGTDGRFVPGTAVVTSIEATVQPASGRDMQTLPEGERQKRGIKLYTTTLLKLADQDAKRLADRIAYDSETFEVRHVEEQPRIIPHYKALALRIDEAT